MCSRVFRRRLSGMKLYGGERNGARNGERGYRAIRDRGRTNTTFLKKARKNERHAEEEEVPGSPLGSDWSVTGQSSVITSSALAPNPAILLVAYFDSRCPATRGSRVPRHSDQPGHAEIGLYPWYPSLSIWLFIRSSRIRGAEPLAGAALLIDASTRIASSSWSRV